MPNEFCIIGYRWIFLNVQRRTSNDEIASLCRFINVQNALFEIRCWMFIVFILHGIEISILLSIKSIDYGKSAQRTLI